MRRLCNRRPKCALHRGLPGAMEKQQCVESHSPEVADEHISARRDTSPQSSRHHPQCDTRRQPKRPQSAAAPQSPSAPWRLQRGKSLQAAPHAPAPTATHGYSGRPAQSGKNEAASLAGSPFFKASSLRCFDWGRWPARPESVCARPEGHGGSSSKRFQSPP